MKLLLHFGMPKAGSNAVQQLLFAHRDMLLDHGILYPESSLGSPDRHHHLTIPAFEGKRLPTAFRPYSPQQAQDEFKQVWAHILQQVSEAQPELVILSTEALFRRLSPAGAHALYRHLTQISTDITAVAYVRQLPSFFSSLVQQRILSQGAIPPLVRASEITEALVSYEAMVGGANMTLFPYESGRDVVTDFCSLLTPYGIDRASLGTLPGRANKSLSAASMYTLLAYKRTPALDETGAPLLKYSGRLAQDLKEMDSVLGLSAPTLIPKIQDYLAPEAYGLEQQLSARYGMQFTTPIQSQAAQNHAAPPLENVTDVSPVKPDEVLRLLQHLSTSSWTQRHNALPLWVADKIAAVKAEQL